MKIKNNKNKLESIRKEIKKTQLILVAATTLLLSFGGLFLNIKSNDKAFNQDLQNTSDLITRLYSFTKDYSQQDLCDYMDSIVEELPGVDVISIVDINNNRIYHTHHELINTQYDGKHPDFNCHKLGYYTENDIGPSGPQRRTYSAIYNDGIYEGFIMTIRLQTSIKSVTIRTVGLFLIVTIIAIVIELFLSRVLFRKIKKEFYTFAEDFEGTKFLVDSMRANNHDFTNKLHVILGLIQIGEYDRAVSYIENISIIQKETVSRVMHAVDNPSFSALLIGKIARASECNVKFILKEDMVFNSDDIDLPSEALVTITGNLIDNAIEACAKILEEEKRQIQITMKPKRNMYYIRIANSSDGIYHFSGKRELLSTKTGEDHGIGLKRMEQVVESYHGFYSYEAKEDTFAVTVILP